MGKRGPGAKPVLTVVQDMAPLPLFAPQGGMRKHQPPAWEADGLSRAERVIVFLESLKITAGVHAGEPFRVRPWQREIIEGVYAVGADGRRAVRQALLTMPRKNGKTGLAAGLALCHLLGPEAEARGQVYSAAADRAQASILFSEMVAIILDAPELAARVNIQHFAKRIEDTVTGSVYQALSADAKTKHGFSASCIVYDELAQAPNRDLYDVLTTSTAARAEPLTIVISTQASDPHHVMSELVDYGRKINDQVIDDTSFHASIFAAPEDADPWDEATWYACNPALGDFRSLEEMRSSAAQAQRIPAREATFRALYLNQPVLQGESRLFRPEDWRECGGSLTEDHLDGPCWGGLDLSSTQDLTALVLFWPHSGAVKAWFWTPAGRLQEKAERDRVPYPLWAEQGHLEATPGRAIDKSYVATRLGELVARHDIQALAFDRWRIEDLTSHLDEEGIKVKLVPFGQGFRDMGPAIDALESLMLDGRLRHPNNPVLTWCLHNAVATTDPAGNRKLDKDRAIERIDGAVALAMAVGLYAKEPPAPSYDFSDMVITV